MIFDMKHQYIQPLAATAIVFKSTFNNPTSLDKSLILNAIHHTHEVLDKINSFEVDVFEILGMRNLSAFIGELFAAAMVKSSGGFLLKNPHQDGYPDMLVMDEDGKRLWEELKLRLRDKQPFSPFPNGGIEVKATCGSLPTPAYFAKKGLVKPTIGDQRIDFLTGYDWKAHHRDTNDLIGLFWDFIDGVPRIAAVFFCSDLSSADWGEIIQPKEGGGRTTSVSIMPRSGVKKMYEGIVFVLEDEKYVTFLNKYNNGTIIQQIPVL